MKRFWDLKEDVAMTGIAAAAVKQRSTVVPTSPNAATALTMTRNDRPQASAM